MARDEVNTAAAVLNLLTRPNRPSLFFIYLYDTRVYLNSFFFICVIIMLN